MQHGRITGVNTFSQQLTMGDQDLFMLFSGAPIAHGHTMGFYVYGVRDTGQGRDGAAERLAGLRDFVRRLLAEDAPVLDTIRFRPRVLVASDRHLARFLKYVREFPRAAAARRLSDAQEPVPRRGRRVPRAAVRGGPEALRQAGASTASACGSSPTRSAAAP